MPCRNPVGRSRTYSYVFVRIRTYFRTYSYVFLYVFVRIVRIRPYPYVKDRPTGFRQKIRTNTYDTYEYVRKYVRNTYMNTYAIRTIRTHTYSFLPFRIRTYSYVLLYVFVRIVRIRSYYIMHAPCSSASCAICCAEASRASAFMMLKPYVAGFLFVKCPLPLTSLSLHSVG